MLSSSHILGKKAEEQVAIYYKNAGYIVLETNLRFYAQNGRGQRAEIDIIAYKNKVLVCIEVKARKNNNLMNALESITKQKLALLTWAMSMYLSSHPQYTDCNIRFDAATIVGQQVNIVENIR